LTAHAPHDFDRTETTIRVRVITFPLDPDGDY
jgi:hypothetical protein